MRFPTSLVGSKLHSWNLKIKELTYSQKWQEVFSHYCEMKKAGDELTDPSLLPLILKSCTKLSSIHGRSVHACLIRQGFESFTSIGNAVIDFYMKCRNLDSAMTMFDHMSDKDSVSWNILIHGHLDQGVLKEGLWWFSKARVTGSDFEPNTSILVLVIQACRNLGVYIHGLKLHCYIIRSGFLSIQSVQNSLLTMYADVDMKCAGILFDEMLERDVISWSVMIGGYLQCEEASSGLQLFREMVSSGGIESDGVIMVSVLKACADLRDLSIGRMVHGLVICRGLDCDLFVGNSLIDMYSKCKDTDSAFKIFNEMPGNNNVSWNSILSGFVLNEKYSEALSLFHSMEKDEVDEVTLVNLLQICRYMILPMICKSIHCFVLRRAYESNELILNSLVDAYAKCYLIELALKVFNGMKRRDVVSWSSMISGFTHCGLTDEAIAVFEKMNQTQEKPNAVTIVNLLEACSVTAELSRSKWAHGVAIRRGLACSVAVGTAVVDTYSKCGAIRESRKAFDQIPQKNIVSWSAMVAAYGMNSLAHEALSLVSEMKIHGLKPNAVTALSVLSACSHGGLVEEGLSFFKSMDVEPVLEHYSCMIDMLARAGRLDQAIDIIKKMPGKNLMAGASAWGALLSGCRNYGNTEVGEGVVPRILELEPMNSAGYLLASNMYAADGLWTDAARMRLLAKEKGVRVIAGYSLVRVNNKACQFIAEDKSNPQGSEINIVVKQLHCCMKIINHMNDLDIFE